MKITEIFIEGKWQWVVVHVWGYILEICPTKKEAHTALIMWRRLCEWNDRWSEK